MQSDLNTWLEAKDPATRTLFEAALQGHLCLEHPFGQPMPAHSVLHDGKLYFERFWRQQQRLIELFEALCKSDPEILFTQPSLKDSGLVIEQQKAIHLALSSRLTCITGGPGTGKTHTAGVLIQEMKRQVPDLRVAVSAPTGRAVGQLKESLLRHLPKEAFSALTLHRMLELWQSEPDVLPYDLVLADEASMIDLSMMIRLFESLKEGGRLILMGDPYQLPPVEPGSVFADLAPFAPHVELKTCLRAELKEIVDFAERIKEQDVMGVLRFLKSRPQAIVWQNSGHFNFSILEKPTLTPLKKGLYGTEALNQRAIKEHPQPPYPILISRNQDKLELYNGDRGFIDSLSPQPGDKAYFGKKILPALFLDHFELAWALSIHKSQGSEFDSLQVLFPEGSETFGVAALYTAVTRAKRHVELWAEEEVLKKLIETSATKNSGIKSLLETKMRV